MRINGNAVSRQIRDTLKSRILHLRSTLNGQVPGLAVLLIGDRKDSSTYVRFKEKAASEIGMNFWLHTFTTDATQQEVLDCIDKCNNNSLVNGIIVQLPLPTHMDKTTVCERVVISKDVDGLKANSLASLAIAATGTQMPKAGFVACTPQGCLELIKSVAPQGIEGKKATVVGRSHIVGMPMALLLMKENATVTVCHHKTPSELLLKELRESDVGHYLKPGAIVIDVGINSGVDGKLVGDVEFSTASLVAGAITPVPGGVGPMTIAMLLQNTLLSFERTHRPSD